MPRKSAKQANAEYARNSRRRAKQLEEGKTKLLYNYRALVSGFLVLS